MKKIFYSLMFLGGLFAACQENKMDDFEKDGAIYFQLNATDWNNTTDSVVYSFAGKTETELMVNLQVNLMGAATDRDREVRISIDKERTTAEEGVHYKTLPTSYTLPAGSYSMQIPVTLIGTDPRLEEQMFQLTLKLEPSDDLQLGLSQRTVARIQVSSMLVKPYYWDDYLVYYWGSYSKVKHETAILLLGINFPETQEEYWDVFYTWDAYANYVSQYFGENYPIYDENGNPIDPWFID